MTTAVHALVFLAVCHVSLGIWQVRNWRQTGYTGFSSIPDVNLYCYDAAWVLSAVQRKPFTEAQQELGCGDTSAYLEVHPDQRRLSRAERYVAMRREGLKLIASEPITFALARAKGTFRSVVNPGGAEWVTLFGVYPRSQELTGQVLDKGLLRTAISLVTGKPHLFWMNICLEVVLLSSYGFAFMALFEQQVRCSRAVWVLLAVFVYFVLISGGAVGTSRFRHPVMPIVAIFAGYGLAHVSVWIRGRRRTGAPQRKGREGAT